MVNQSPWPWPRAILIKVNEVPLVTIVTPSLNSGRYIRHAIESILAQDYPRIEHIIVDGGSSDGTREILAEYPGIKVVDSAPDNGAAHAINIGFQKAAGSIFTWLNADDAYLPGAISSAVQRFQQEPGLDVVYGKTFWIDTEGVGIGSYPTQAFQADALSRECIISQPATFIRSAAFRSIGMLNPDEKYTFDYDLWIRMAKACRFEYVSEYWANCRMHPSSITFSDRRRVLEANMRLLKRHYGYVPLQWIYGYCCHIRDSRDQFFEPLRHSTIAYATSLSEGLSRNPGHKGRFIKDWISALLRRSALKSFWQGLATGRNHGGLSGPSAGPGDKTDGQDLKLNVSSDPSATNPARNGGSKPSPGDPATFGSAFQAASTLSIASRVRIDKSKAG